MSTYISWNKGEKIQITPHFNSNELECNCSYSDCIEQKINKQHIEKLEKKRIEWGKSVKVTSGFRCIKHNQEEGGRPNSLHLKGDATDIQVKDISPDKIADSCEDFDGLGRYKTFTHIDSRGSKARW